MKSLRYPKAFLRRGSIRRSQIHYLSQTRASEITTKRRVLASLRRRSVTVHLPPMTNHLLQPTPLFYNLHLMSVEQSTMSDSVNEILWNSMATPKNSEVTPHEAIMSSDLGHTEADTSFWHLCFRCVRSGYSCHATVFNIHFQVLASI
jgi:hypothetical protein